MSWIFGYVIGVLVAVVVWGGIINKGKEVNFLFYGNFKCEKVK